MKDIVPVTFSARAIDETRRMMIKQNVLGEYGLRVAIGGGGCGSGGEVAPILGFDKQKEADTVYEISGITILIDKRHLMYLAGKHVEFYEVEGLSGFHFTDIKKQ